MNSVRIGWLALLGVLVVVGAWAVTTAWAAHCGGTTGRSCTEDIRETKHNLAVNTDIMATGTTEVCVFCHTPHGGRTDVAGGGAPLWNRALPPTAPATYNTYDSPNFDNDLGAETAGPKGVSLACLSCHDGTIALDALINAPCSGGFLSVNRTGAAPTWIDTIDFDGTGVDSADSMAEGNRIPSPSPPTDPQQGFLGGRNDYVGGPGGMEPFPNLSRNLTDDHPISRRMPSTDPQFTDALNNSPAAVGNANIRSVQRAGAQLPTDKRDQIRLYNSGISSGTSVSVDWVECASCHNPHTPRTTLLRLPSVPAGLTAPADGDVSPVATRNLNHEPNQGSLICLTCHQK